MEQELALHGLFLYLVQRGFSLGIRDYQDALRALKAGYGMNNRQNLLWLCQTLWAHSDVEHHAISDLFKNLPQPTQAEIHRLEGLPDSISSPSGPSSPNIAKASNDVQEVDSTETRDKHLIPGMQFAPPKQKGLGLPRAQIKYNENESFILRPQSSIPLRSLIIAWRRFRSPLRTGPKVELDLDATIIERSQKGLLETPVFIAARRNQAKIVILIDVSSSMVVWTSFTEMLISSLRESQLGQVAVYFFDNVPIDALYRRQTLTQPLSLEKALKLHFNSTLLVFSDSGAARGSTNRERIGSTRKFLDHAARSWQPVAWINPVPKVRWKNTSAEVISQLTKVAMVELTDDGLINAIDVLRGLKTK